MGRLFPSRTVTVSIDAPASRVASFIANPENLPLWAAGLARSVRREGDAWIVESEVLFMLFQRPGVSDADFAADVDAVTRDLAALKKRLEAT